MKKIYLFFSIIYCFNMFVRAELINSGQTFLQVPTSAQTAATMTVFSQSAQQPLTIFENPVGIRTTTTHFALAHHFWFSDVSIDAFAFALPLRKSSIGFGLNYVRIPGVEIRDYPTDEPLSNVEPQYIAAAAAYVWSPKPSLALGITTKYLFEHLYTYTDHGLALDIAARLQLPTVLDLSVQLSNIGTLQTSNEENALPATLTIGIVRPQLFEGNGLNAAVGLNLGSNLVSEKTFAEAGAEINYRELLYLRGGFAHIGSTNKESLGFGININRFGFDYAYLFMPEGLGNPQIVTIDYRL